VKCIADKKAKIQMPRLLKAIKFDLKKLADEKKEKR
jgi:hypothetical protein